MASDRYGKHFGTYSIAEIRWWSYCRTEVKAGIMAIILSLNGYIPTIIDIIKHHHITIVYCLSISSPTSIYSEVFSPTSTATKVTTLGSCTRAGSFVTAIVIWAAHPGVVLMEIVQSNSLARLN